MTLLVTGGVTMVVASGEPPLRLLAVVVIAVMAGGLLGSVSGLISVAFGAAVVEIGLAVVGGSVTLRSIPGLVVGLYLVVELSTITLEVAGVARAPVEPAGRRLLEFVGTAAIVALSATAILYVADSVDVPGTFTQIAGVAAAAAVLASLATLIERRT
jgi:hypothetical protein